MISTIKYSLIFLFLAYSSFSYACSKFEIPYSTEIFKDEDELNGVLVRLPNTYKQWVLDVVIYRTDSFHIPMRLSNPDKDGYVTTSFFTTIKSLKDAKVEASYKLKPKEDGSISLCIKSQVIKFDI